DAPRVLQERELADGEGRDGGDVDRVGAGRRERRADDQRGRGGGAGQFEVEPRAARRQVQGADGQGGAGSVEGGHGELAGGRDVRHGHGQRVVDVALAQDDRAVDRRGRGAGQRVDGRAAAEGEAGVGAGRVHRRAGQVDRDGPALVAVGRRRDRAAVDVEGV